MKSIAKDVLKRILYVARMIFTVLLIVPILIFMLWVNYTVDRSGYFQGDAFVRSMATLLINGENVSGYEKMDERQVSKLFVRNMVKVPNTVALGSSRILQMNKNVCGDSSFFNFGMVGADYTDVMSTFYLLLKENKLPQNIIIGFDPWFLNGNEDALDIRSDKALFAEYLKEKLNIDTGYKQKKDDKKWEALISPGYFQGNIRYYLKDSKTAQKPQSVQGDLMNQPTEIKMSDGSVLYTKKAREASTEEVISLAINQAQTFLRMEGYEAPNGEVLDLFGRMLTIAKQKNINIVFVISPFNPDLWDNVLYRKAEYPGFFATEEAIKKLAQKYEIPVYGSYNPYAFSDISPEDFFDGLHIKGEAIQKFFPGIKTAISGEIPPMLDHTALKPAP